ncbi:tail protein (endogenous virus) [Lactococcus phage KSY1]|uniref:Gp066 n=1 Tax=Lactococcus phage KSY1 TaxID=2913972 RepID=A6MAD1_9CAUD|nr:tail protein [Lactococcus phage KSY1]ABG21609.1 gp066 [Lactococcus phage KSY1]
MANIKKIYRGMQNGAETINENLEAINAELISGGNVVHKTGDESVGGKKTFTDDMTVKNISASGSLTSKIVSTKMDSPAIKHTFIRTGNTVTLTTETKSGIAQTTAYSIPSGYRPFNDGTNPIYEQVLSGGKSAIIRSSNAKWQPRKSAGLDGNLFGTTSWPTNDSFPG